MSDENALIEAQQEDLGLQEYGTRTDIDFFAKRLQAMLPGGEKLGKTGAMALAQYAIAMDANPFRGEVYAWVDWKGNLVLDEGYKLLVRWAKRQCPYTEKYEVMPKEQLGAGDIGAVCWILRQDALPTLKMLTESGMNAQDAFEIAATKAVGVVVAQEMKSRKTGKPISPPTGWTWLQVAEKRALKNCINRSHGAPSPKEISAESWKVGDIQTRIEDWATVKPEMNAQEREAEAVYNAERRERKEQGNEPVSADQAIDELCNL